MLRTIKCIQYTRLNKIQKCLLSIQFSKMHCFTIFIVLFANPEVITRKGIYPVNYYLNTMLWNIKTCLYCQIILINIIALHVCKIKMFRIHYKPICFLSHTWTQKTRVHYIQKVAAQYIKNSMKLNSYYLAENYLTNNFLIGRINH